jgi:hypothetical protein
VAEASKTGDTRYLAQGPGVLARAAAKSQTVKGESAIDIL